MATENNSWFYGAENLSVVNNLKIARRIIKKSRSGCVYLPLSDTKDATPIETNGKHHGNGHRNGD